MASLRLGCIDESFYRVVGGIVASVLRRHGHDVVVTEGSHTDVYAALGTGAIDLAVAFWLPYGHAEAWKRLGDDVTELTTLYERAQFYWAMPSYVDERIVSIADLASPKLSDEVPRVVRGLSLDATITTASMTAIASYGLDALGFRLEPGDFATWEASLVRAVAAKRPVILPLWTPYYLNVVYDLRVLADPKNVLGQPNRVVLGARRDVAQRIDRATIAGLGAAGLTLDVVSELDRRIHVEARSADDVAEEWLGSQTPRR